MPPATYNGPVRISIPRNAPVTDYRRHVRIALLMIVLTIALGTTGFRAIEGRSLFDSFYFTVVTVATIGYGDVTPQTPAGRAFTILLIFMSLGTVTYGLSTLARFVVEGEFDRLLHGRKMDKRIAQLADHIILCGGGKTAERVAEELIKTRHDFVVIERDSEVIEDILKVGDFPYLQDDATEDEALEAAGIRRARGLIAALADDKDNIFVVMTARQLNAELRIVARLVDESNAKKLRKAGADELVSPNAIGGLRMASVMIRPMAVSFLDTMLRHTGGTTRVDEVEIGHGSELEQLTIAEAAISSRTGMLVMAIRPLDGAHQYNPSGQARLHAGDTLIVMGSSDQLRSLKALASAP